MLTFPISSAQNQLTQVFPSGAKVRRSSQRSESKHTIGGAKMIAELILTSLQTDHRCQFKSRDGRTYAGFSSIPARLGD